MWVVNEGAESREWEHPSAAHEALPAEHCSGADDQNAGAFWPPLTAGVRQPKSDLSLEFMAMKKSEVKGASIDSFVRTPSDRPHWSAA